MDYSQLAPTIVPQIIDAVNLINNPEVDPETRQLNQEILFREVGQAIYQKIYEMNAWDMGIGHTTGPGIDNRYFGLAKVASGSISTGAVGLNEYIANYVDNTIGLAQHHAFINASQSGKHPTVTRTVTNPKACQWCVNLAGTYTNPSPEVFQRHGSCDCEIQTEGYKSRNGLLDNYSGGPISKTNGSVNGQTVYRGVGGANFGGAGNMFGNALYVTRDKNVAQQFGTVSKLNMPLSSKDIMQITSDAQLEKVQLDAQRWAVKKGGSIDSNSYLPAYIRSKGYKAVEVAPSVDPLGGIAIVDPATIKKMQAQSK